MTDSREEWVLHNTRLTRRNRRALELAASGGSTLQQMTNDAVGAYLETHFPDVLAAVGDPEEEGKQMLVLLAGRQQRQQM